MTYLHISEQGLAKHTIGERRSDHATAQNVHDALRGRGLQAVAQALACQQVSLAIALRILSARDGLRRPLVHSSQSMCCSQLLRLAQDA